MTDKKETQAWILGLKNSIKNVSIGAILVISAIGCLWWNEGRAVAVAKSLDEGTGVVQSISSDALDPETNGKLVHLTGGLRVGKPAKDKFFNLEAQAVALRRVVEIYQWKEVKTTSSSTGKKKKKRKKTKATYSKVWSTTLIDSTKFNESASHSNPKKLPLPTETFYAEDVQLGAYKLSSGLMAQMKDYSKLPISNNARQKFPSRWRDSKPTAKGLFFGVSPSSPQVGDVRINFSIVKTASVSVAAAQNSGRLGPFLTKAGASIEILKVGNLTADQIFQRVQDENDQMTWAYRLGSLVFLFVGILMILGPIAFLGNSVPVVGDMFVLGLWTISGLLSCVIGLSVVSVSWIFFRPLIGGGLLVLGIGAIAGAKFYIKKNPVPESEGFTMTSVSSSSSSDFTMQTQESSHDPSDPSLSLAAIHKTVVEENILEESSFDLTLETSHKEISIESAELPQEIPADSDFDEIYEWFIYRNDIQEPDAYTLSQIKQLPEFPHAVWVWKDGFADWASPQDLLEFQ